MTARLIDGAVEIRWRGLYVTLAAHRVWHWHVDRWRRVPILRAAIVDGDTALHDAHGHTLAPLHYMLYVRERRRLDHYGRGRKFHKRG